MTKHHSSGPADVRIRLMRAGDVEAGIALVEASGWNQTDREWRLFLEIAPDGALVAEREGRVVGTAVTVPYTPDTAWVAMVLVDPAVRGQGIGRALLREALRRVPHGYVARLDATPAGRALYVTLGFEDEGRLSRWRCAARVDASAGPGVRPMAATDWDDVLALDRQVSGLDRGGVLAWCRDGAPDFAWIGRGGADGGYVLGRRGRETDHVGPVVAASTAEACALVAACLSRAGRPGVSIDAPDGQAAFGRWLAAHGFAVERRFTRMRRGPAQGSPLSPRIFASVGPEFG
jgi:GNAT superfamily N-acetyltransferase